MLELSQIESGVSHELCLLLELRPAEVRASRTVVLTTAPSLWTLREDGKQLRVADLSTALGVRSVGASSERDPREVPLQGTSSRELAASILQYKPDAVVIDFTIPFGLSFPPSFVLRDPASPLAGMVPDNASEIRHDWIDAQHVLLAWAAGIPSVGALSAITSSSVTTDPADDWLRQHLSTRLKLSAVIELPADTLRPLSSDATSLLFFGGDRPDVYFDSLTSRGDLVDMETRPWFKSLLAWMGMSPSDLSSDRAAGDVIEADADGPLTVPGRTAMAEGSEEGYKASVMDGANRTVKEAATGYTVAAESGSVWSLDVSGADVADMYERIRRLAETVALGDVCEIVEGVAAPRRVEESEGGVPLIEPRNLKEGSLDVDGARRVRDRGVPEEARIQVGDVLLSQNITERFSVSLNRYNGPGILSRGVIAVRPKSDRITAEYLFEYLSSSAARKLLAATVRGEPVTSNPQLSLEQLRGFPVPVVDRDRVQGLSSVQLAERALRDRADELQSARRALFDSRNEREFNRHLDRLRRRGKLLSISVQSLESLDYQIAVTYPFPIAYGYRLLQGSADLHDLYKEQFRLVENLLAFLGSLCLALLEPPDRGGIGMDPERGMTIGKWRDIIALSSKVFIGYRDNPLGAAICDLKIGVKTKGFGGDIEEIVQARNEWAHLRDSSLPEDMVEATRARQERLQRCMKALGFLAEYPIRQIQQPTRRRTGEWQLECLCYRGDHPGLPQEIVHFHGNLPAGDLTRDLFLDLGKERWLSLYPFITVWNCRQCKWRETYQIDIWDLGKSTVRLRSFERGHAESKPELSRALEEWSNRASG